MKLEEILIKHFGWTEQEVKEERGILQSIYIKDENKVLEKAKMFRQQFDLTEIEFIKIIKQQPSLLVLTEERVKEKVGFYQNELNLSKSEFIKMLKKLPNLLTFSEETIKQKVKFYQLEFNLNKSEFIKILKISHSLLSYSEESIKAKVRFYQQEFGLNKSEFIKKIKILPSLLHHSEETLKTKAEFYQQEFVLSKSEFNNIFMRSPAIMCYSEEGVKDKVKFYQQEFGVSKEEFIKMIKLHPSLLDLSEASVKEKHIQISNLHIPKSIIVKDPSILTAPTNTLKVRYTILRQVAAREEILLKRGWFMTSQNKTYARLKYLQTKSSDIKLSHIMQAEKPFVDMFGVESKDLMKKYKLTPKAIQQMQEVLKDGEMVDFTSDEQQFINEEYGV